MQHDLLWVIVILLGMQWIDQILTRGQNDKLKKIESQLRRIEQRLLFVSSYVGEAQAT